MSSVSLSEDLVELYLYWCLKDEKIYLVIFKMKYKSHLHWFLLQLVLATTITNITLNRYNIIYCWSCCVIWLTAVIAVYNFTDCCIGSVQSIWEEKKHPSVIVFTNKKHENENWGFGFLSSHFGNIVFQLYYEMRNLAMIISKANIWKREYRVILPWLRFRHNSFLTSFNDSTHNSLIVL